MPRSIHPAGALNFRVDARSAYTPSDLSVTLTHLDLAPSPDLFGIDPFNERSPKERVVTALDTINAHYGLNTVYLGSIHQVRQESSDSENPVAAATSQLTPSRETTVTRPEQGFEGATTEVQDGATGPVIEAAQIKAHFTYTAGLLKPNQAVVLTADDPATEGRRFEWLFGDGREAKVAAFATAFRIRRERCSTGRGAFACSCMRAAATTNNRSRDGAARPS
jgi:hypothetical protein